MGVRVLVIAAIWLAACGGDGAAGGAPDAASPVDGATGPDAPPGAKRIFISSAKFAGQFGGLAGADYACVAAAQDAQLNGNWVAWLSSSTVDAIDRVHDVGPWYDLGGNMIFADRANLMTSPLTALWLDEHGSFLPSDRIWTATGPGGRYQEAIPGHAPCAEWTAGVMVEDAQVGQVGHQDGGWTSAFSTSCDQQGHLICLEQ